MADIEIYEIDSHPDETIYIYNDNDNNDLIDDYFDNLHKRNKPAINVELIDANKQLGVFLKLFNIYLEKKIGCDYLPKEIKPLINDFENYCEILEIKNINSVPLIQLTIHDINEVICKLSKKISDYDKYMRNLTSLSLKN